LLYTYHDPQESCCPKGLEITLVLKFSD